MPPNTPTNPAPLPVGFLVSGSEDFDSEDLLAYELGYRFAHSAISVDVATFYHDYTNLQDNTLAEAEVRYIESPPYIAQPGVFTNNDAGSYYGAELALAWRTKQWLRWNVAYSFMKNDKWSDNVTRSYRTVDPEHQVSVVCGLQPVRALNLSVSARYVDDAVARSSRIDSGNTIPSYSSLDARIGWRVSDDVEFSLAGQNLLDDHHFEYIAEKFTLPTEVVRSFYAKIRWDF